MTHEQGIEAAAKAISKAPFPTKASRSKAEAAIAAYLAASGQVLVPRVQWQPIETAPKDGTHILVGHDQGCFSAWWETSGVETNTGEAAWVDGSTNSYEEYYTYSPTHWMPLPAPPAAQEPKP